MKRRIRRGVTRGELHAKHAYITHDTVGEYT